MDLLNKVVLVSGAAKGIGAAVARICVREGAAVGVIDYDLAAAQALVADIEVNGGQALALPADVSKAADAQRAVNQAVATFGGVDILVNNAGIQTYGTVESMSEEDWDRTLSVNLKSVFLMSKYAVPEIRRRGGGAIVNMASIQALATQPAVSAYAASKGGIVAMTRSMALDFAADHIRVNCVCPGSVDTPMLRWAADLFGEGDPTGAIQSWGKLHALGRVARADEIAELVLFLASARSSFCTGAAYLADGGILASFA